MEYVNIMSKIRQHRIAYLKCKLKNLKFNYQTENAKGKI